MSNLKRPPRDRYKGSKRRKFNERNTNNKLTEEQKFLANQKAWAFGDPPPYPQGRTFKNMRFEEVRTHLNTPMPKVGPDITLDQVKDLFSLPLTMALPQEKMQKLRSDFAITFDHAGGYEQLHQTLTSHLHDLGQYPIETFAGYGKLSNLAQNYMINRAVKVVAYAITKNWIEVKGGEIEDKERVKILSEQIQTRFNLQSLFRDAITRAGFYGGAFIFIDTGERGENLALPLIIDEHSNELSKGHRLRFQVIDPINVSPCEYNATYPLEPDYMKPRLWYVSGDRVHASRLMAIYDDEPPTLLKPAYNFLGIPLAQKLQDVVGHWNLSRITVNNLLDKLSLLVMQTNVDEALATAGGMEMLDMRMQGLERYRNNNSVFLCDLESEAVQNVQTSISGAADIVKMNREDIAAAVGVPGVVLFGLSPGGFNATGESDMKTYFDHVRAQQEVYRPQIQRCLNAIQLVLFGSIDDSIYFDFAQVSIDNGTSLAMNNSTKLNSIVAAVGAGVISAEEGREFLRRDIDMGFDFLPEELPPELQQQEPQEQEQEGGDPLAALLGSSDNDSLSPDKPDNELATNLEA